MAGLGWHAVLTPPPRPAAPRRAVPTRWCNQLNPHVKKEPFDAWEDAVIVLSHRIHGNKWASEWFPKRKGLVVWLGGSRGPGGFAGGAGLLVRWVPGHVPAPIDDRARPMLLCAEAGPASRTPPQSLPSCCPGGQTTP